MLPVTLKSVWGWAGLVGFVCAMIGQVGAIASPEADFEDWLQEHVQGVVPQRPSVFLKGWSCCIRDPSFSFEEDEKRKLEDKLFKSFQAVQKWFRKGGHWETLSAHHRMNLLKGFFVRPGGLSTVEQRGSESFTKRRKTHDFLNLLENLGFFSEFRLLHWIELYSTQIVSLFHFPYHSPWSWRVLEEWLGEKMQAIYPPTTSGNKVKQNLVLAELFHSNLLLNDSFLKEDAGSFQVWSWVLIWTLQKRAEPLRLLLETSYFPGFQKGWEETCFLASDLLEEVADQIKKLTPRTKEITQIFWRDLVKASALVNVFWKAGMPQPWHQVQKFKTPYLEHIQVFSTQSLPSSLWEVVLQYLGEIEIKDQTSWRNPALEEDPDLESEKEESQWLGDL